ncbi:MAG: haloacid dehalogenase-like hydrolase [Candidatus Omnitrophica bacterium]|nr:haloacid dehalogenase-like hydrolase [Candidatus Omnitrophota bacterium]
MLIGLDFDNTIVCYDQVFHRIAWEEGWIPKDLPQTKGSVRDYLRQAGKEEVWIQLQGRVYGSRILEAPPFPGVAEFFIRCKERGTPIVIVSHKTRFPFRGPAVDLHHAASEWFTHHRFFRPSSKGLLPHGVYFEETKEGKLSRIGSLGCTHFVDDLPEFLLEPGFPVQVERILFNPGGMGASDPHFYRATSWRNVEERIFGKRDPAGL